MKRLYIILQILILATAVAVAQERRAENRPYCDLRPFHLGVVVGTHWQDTEFDNVGLHTLQNADGTTSDCLITCDQDRWDLGFQVGVLGEMRLNTYFALRIAPTIYFGNRHYVFHNLLKPNINGHPTEERQDMKTAYIGCDFDLIYAAKRFNNHRPYMMMGVVPMVNLTTKANDYLQMKNSSLFFEVGLGCDFYMPFFKFRPELKFMYSLSNTLNNNHPDDLRDPAMKQYATAVNRATSKMIALTFYFE